MPDFITYNEEAKSIMVAPTRIKYVNMTYNLTIELVNERGKANNYTFTVVIKENSDMTEYIEKGNTNLTWSNFP